MKSVQDIKKEFWSQLSLNTIHTQRKNVFAKKFKQLARISKIME